MKEVVLVTDEPQLPLERVEVVCPPIWARRLLGRVGARTIWVVIAGFRYRPDLYMGYYLAPGACSALVVGRLLGRPSCYQMTGGPVGIIGGGFAAIDSIEGALGRPSKFIESLALRVIRKFELVVVRGNRAKEFLATRGIKDSVAVITGCVNDCRQPPQNDRDIHLIYVGRLSPVKQLGQFVTIVDSMRHFVPNIRAVIVGDGSLRRELQTCTERLGLTENVEFLGRRRDVEVILARSKVFVLTSKSEGLSIAMAEAMAAGVVPVVANVGDLADLVVDGENGYLVEPGNIEEYTSKAISLLYDESLWTQFSDRAREAARKHCSIETVTEKWRKSLRKAISEASGCIPEEVLNNKSDDLTQMEI
jgi:glycosyltransferase involved in cell wall biosynthesis